MARPRKKAIKVGSSASFKPTKKQTRYGDIEKPHASSDDEKMEPRDAALKHGRGRPRRAKANIEQFNPPAGDEGEENASVPQPDVIGSKERQAAPKRKRGQPKPQIGHIERPHTLPGDQTTDNAPQEEPNTKVRGLGRKGKQAQPRNPNNRIGKLRSSPKTCQKPKQRFLLRLRSKSMLRLMFCSPTTLNRLLDCPNI